LSNTADVPDAHERKIDTLVVIRLNQNYWNRVKRCENLVRYADTCVVVVLYPSKGGQSAVAFNDHIQAITVGILPNHQTFYCQESIREDRVLELDQAFASYATVAAILNAWFVEPAFLCGYITLFVLEAKVVRVQQEVIQR